jgi:hypothetical protein
MAPRVCKTPEPGTPTDKGEGAMSDSTDAKQCHKCADCGFLTVYGTVDEVGLEMRRAWPMFSGVTDAGPQHLFPSCYEEAFPLKEETSETLAGTRSGNWQGPLAVITKDRDCPQFTKWLPHKTPEEHRQMLHEKELREEHDEREARNQRFLKEQADMMFRRQFITIIVSALFGASLTGIAGWLARLNVQESKDGLPKVIEFKPVINNILPAPEKLKEKD